jgi:hypothetical protein
VRPTSAGLHRPRKARQRKPHISDVLAPWRGASFLRAKDYNTRINGTEGNNMLFLRILGICLILLGLIFCATIIGAAIGVPMLLFGLLFIVVGRKRTPIVVQINNDRSQGS